MARRPVTKRRHPDYFSEHANIRLEYFEGWRVGVLCNVMRMWTWENLNTVRIGPKLKTEATTVAIRLLQESAARWDGEARKAQARAGQLLKQAFGIARHEAPAGD